MDDCDLCLLVQISLCTIFLTKSLRCKEWGFLLKELFGCSLGTGDYGHLLIDHAPMLMRRFFSMSEFSQQGFEASHKDQRQLWLKATSHDQQGEASSSKSEVVTQCFPK